MTAIGFALIATACSGGEGGGSTTALSPSTTAAAATTAAPATTAAATATTTAVETSATTSTSTTTAPTSSTPGVYLTVEAVWEGELQTITLHEDGLLVAGSAQGQADVPATSEYFKQESIIEVVELGAAEHTHAIHVSLPSEGDEDPPILTQLFVVEGKLLRKVLSQQFAPYGLSLPAFPGDGTVSYLESGWTACGRLDYPEVAIRDWVTIGFVEGGDMADVDRRPSDDSQRCDELAACPYVYVMANGGEEFIGEILRNVRGRDAYTTQGLGLPTHHGLLHIQLREEKEEVTFLDAISLLVDGQEVLPRECSASGDLGHCTADGLSLRLAEGDIFDLWFEVPEGAESLELSVTGYYVPTPTLNDRESTRK